MAVDSAGPGSDRSCARHGHAIRYIAELRGIIVVRGDGCAVGLNQRQGAAVGADFEVGMELLAGHREIVARGENHQVPAGRYRHIGHRTGIRVGKPPFCEVARVVGQIPAVKGLYSVGGIVNLDPIGVLAEFVHQRGIIVGGHELRDIERAAVEQPAGFERLRARWLLDVRLRASRFRLH